MGLAGERAWQGWGGFPRKKRGQGLGTAFPGGFLGKEELAEGLQVDPVELQLSQGLVGEADRETLT